MKTLAIGGFVAMFSISNALIFMLAMASIMLFHNYIIGIPSILIGMIFHISTLNYLVYKIKPKTIPEQNKKIQKTFVESTR
jgi:predicted membrane protein